jgi:polyisoprenoid-binding protein YceI
MKKLTLIAGLAFGLFSFVPTDATSWGIDAMHSHVGFSINHLGINEVQGNFGKFDSKITSSKVDFSDAVFEFSAEAASVNTGVSMRDEHIKKADILDAEKFPSLTFKSTSISKGKDGAYKVVGDLTLHGVTKAVELSAKYNGGTTHPMNKKAMAGFTIKGMIKRSDFGIAKEMPAPMLSDEMGINVFAEYAKN